MDNLSHLANTLIPSEIIKLGNEINEKIKAGQTIYNFTIGDFDPAIFPIPQRLEDEIVNAYRNKKTNYPPAAGIVELRKSIANFIHQCEGLEYDPNQFLISGGGRPLIYATYRTICDKGEKIIYPVPSWNNNHYTHFVEGEHICIETKAENNFMPTVAEIEPHIKDAVLLALCSPLNPTGTQFTKEQLTSICELVLNENIRRGTTQKPLYILYDQIYWTLTHEQSEHYNPVTLFPALKDYTIFIDGISKAFCATGVRVGWAFGPQQVIDKMKGILSHIGAWSPMAEQYATAKYLENIPAVKEEIEEIKEGIYIRLKSIYQGFEELKKSGYPVDVISPSGAIYLAIRFSLKGKQKPDGTLIEHTSDITAYLLKHAGLAIVPFAAFGADKESEWYRLSVGTCPLHEIPNMFAKLKTVLDNLK
jgi:aspartate aminotransferase